jgi:hypothetical protein
MRTDCCNTPQNYINKMDCNYGFSEQIIKASPWACKDPEEFLFKTPSYLEHDEFQTPNKANIPFNLMRNNF